MSSLRRYRFSIQGFEHPRFQHSWWKSYVNFWVHCHAATLFPWKEHHGMGTSYSQCKQARQNGCSWCPKRSEKIRPQKTESKYYFTNGAPAYPSTAYTTVLIWLNLSPPKGVQQTWPNTAVFPYPAIGDTVQIFHCRSVRQITYGTSVNSKNKTCLC